MQTWACTARLASGCRAGLAGTEVVALAKRLRDGLGHTGHAAGAVDLE